MESNPNNTIYCTSCGAQFDASLPNCPFCGTLNYHTAEKEYLKKLEDVREDMEDLRELPGEHTKEELQNQFKRVRKIVIIVGTVFILLFGGLYLHGRLEDIFYEKREEQSMKWLDENGERFEELYADKQYGDMLELFRETTADGVDPPFNWKLYPLIDQLKMIDECTQILQEEADGRTMNKYDYYVLFSDEWSLLERTYKLEDVSEEDLAYIDSKLGPIREDFDSRWDLTPEKLEEFREEARRNYGYLSYTKKTDYVDEWLKREK